MSKKIKILHLEDDNNILKMVDRILTSKELNHKITRVETEKEFVAEVQKDCYDLIIADYSLPEYNGISALSALKKINKEVPFILFTGSIGEEKAILSLKMGATDYVLKQNVQALYPAINRALNESGARKKSAQIQKQLEESHELLEKISSTVLDAIIMMDDCGNVSFWNLAAENIFGYTASEIKGKNLHDLLAPSHLKKEFEKNFSHYQLTGKGRAIGKSLELIALRKDGTQFEIDLSLSAINIKNKWHAIGIIRDITERKKIEKILREKEEKYRLIVENAHDGIEITQNDKIIFSNSQFNRMLGYSEKEVENMPFSQIFTKEATIELKEREKLRKSKKSVPYNYQTKFIKKNGTKIDVDVKYEIIDYKGKPATFAIIRDVTEIKQAQQNLIQNEIRYRTLYESTTDAIMMLDENGFFDCNPKTLSMFGVDDKKTFCSFHPKDLSPPKQCGGLDSLTSANNSIKIAFKNGSHRFEWLHKRMNTGEIFPAEVLLSKMELDGKEVLQATVRDITERKNLEIQLSQAQKLESIGQLAAGIAHEINTPIQFVSDNTHFLGDSFNDISKLIIKYRSNLDQNYQKSIMQKNAKEISDFEQEIDIDYLIEDIPSAIEQTLDGVKRVSKIVKAMKDFSHPGQEEKTKINLNNAIENTIIISKNEWKYVANINTDFDMDIPLVNCFPGELNQVFLNIIVNAAHAIQDKIGSEPSSKGEIKIVTEYDSEYVIVKISDTGKGIPKEILTKIFNPFFTTKKVGKGTGQGLAISHSVVTQKHDGLLEVETKIGEGSTFIIKLPIENN